MTETLNYDPTDPDAPEFSEDEQDSLKVAEKLGEEESELYAGKFENAEELEKTFIISSLFESIFFNQANEVLS